MSSSSTPKPQTFVYHNILPQDLALEADVYLPEGEPPADGFPVWFLIHGGGGRSPTPRRPTQFALGDRAGLPAHELDEAVHRRRWAVVTMDYPLCPAAKIADQLDSIKACHRWVHEKLPSLLSKRINPNELVVCGWSASGYYALASGFAFEPKPKAIMAFYPSTRFDDWMVRRFTSMQLTGFAPWPKWDDKVADQVLHSTKMVASTPFSDLLPRSPGAPPRHPQCDFVWRHSIQGDIFIHCFGFDPSLPENRDRHAETCALFHVGPDFPPTYLVGGTMDDVCPVFQATEFASLLKEKGVPHELNVLEGQGHVFESSPVLQLQENPRTSVFA